MITSYTIILLITLMLEIIYYTYPVKCKVYNKKYNLYYIKIGTFYNLIEENNLKVRGVLI